MKTIAIIQARLGSDRLPGKVLMEIAGLPMLAWVVRAARASRLLDGIYVAFPHRDDRPLRVWCDVNQVDCYAGSELNVLSRYREIAWIAEADRIVRLTADCPFLDPVLIDVAAKEDMFTTAYWPDGMDVQSFPHWRLYTDYSLEHVIDWPAAPQYPRADNLRHVRLTVDTIEDLNNARMLAQFLPKHRPPTWRETLGALQQVKAAA